MESLRLLQRKALHQLLQTRPGRETLQQLQKTSQQPFRTRPAQINGIATRSIHTQRPSFSPRFPRTLRHPSRTTRRFNSSTTSSTASSSEANLSLSQRLKKLSREYGWSALGVYLALSALDFPFCFLAVKMLGTDRIGHWEHVILSYIKGVVKWPLGETEQQSVDDASQQVKDAVAAPVEIKRVLRGEEDKKRLLEIDQRGVELGAGGGGGSAVLSYDEEVEDHGYREAEQANRGANASLWTQLALAYAIHKSFIFVRVPLTAAVTPKVVKTLRGWGWKIGKMPTRKTGERISIGRGSKSGSGTSKETGVNTKGSGV